MAYYTCCICNFAPLPKFTTSSQHRYYDVKFATLYQRCLNTLQHVIDVVKATLIQSCNRKVKLTMSSQRRYYDVAPIFWQVCEEYKMETILGHTLHKNWSFLLRISSYTEEIPKAKFHFLCSDMVTFPQHWLKVMTKFMTFSCYAGLILWYIKFSTLFPSNNFKVFKTCFRKV